jgi:hypothetical protein
MLQSLRRALVNWRTQEGVKPHFASRRGYVGSKNRLAVGSGSSSQLARSDRLLRLHRLIYGHSALQSLKSTYVNDVHFCHLFHSNSNPMILLFKYANLDQFLR